jgi:hypothetical protein
MDKNSKKKSKNKLKTPPPHRSVMGGAVKANIKGREKGKK